MIQTGAERSRQLRELATWYREYAERAAAPWVFEGRLQTADDLDRHAALLEARPDRNASDGGAAIA